MIFFENFYANLENRLLMHLHLLIKYFILLFDFLFKLPFIFIKCFWMPLLFIEKDISICWNFQIISPLFLGIIPTKCFMWQLFFFKLSHRLIIKFKPLLSHPDDRIIMARFRISRMDNNWLQSIQAILFVDAGLFA